MELAKKDLIIHAICDPHENTELGNGLTYKKFKAYVNYFLAPYMQMEYIEEDYYEDIWNDIWNNQHIVLQLPRGCSKTEFIGIWITIYIADYQPENPYYYKYKGKHKKIIEQQLIAGASTDLDAWVERIKDFFYRVPILQRLKPSGVSKEKTSNKWNNKEMILANGSQLHLRTIKGKIRGTHNDRTVGDDLITESATLTDKQTIDIWDGAVDGTNTAKEAMVQVIGTPLRYTDIQFHLKNKPEGYFFKARPAIIDWDKKLVLGSKRRSFDDFMRIKARIGTMKFSTEYMLNPIDDETSLVKREHMLACLDQYMEGMWIKPILSKTGNEVTVQITKINNFQYRRADWEFVYITADFAFSDRTTADHSVFSYYGIKNGKKHRLGYLRSESGTAWSPMTQFAILKAMFDYFSASMLALEENSIKGILNDVKHLNMPIKLYWMGNTDKAPTFKPEVNFSAKRHIIGKVMGIERLGASYENLSFVIPYKTEMDKVNADLQIQETVSWALDDGKLVEIGGHPDIPITDILVNELSYQPSSISPGFLTRGADPGELEDKRERIIVEGDGIYGEDTI
uniref:Uncharacterized protein n=1 Tax=viral metagenome TaxID=1070528 RepID=A0A6M3JK34_9ZZZZ